MLDRTIAPVTFQYPEFVLPNIEQTHLNDGLPIHIIKDDTLQFIKIEVILRNAGSIHDSTPGCGFLISKLLQAGTNQYNAVEIADLIAQKGAFIEVNPSFDYSIASVYVLNKFADNIVPLFQNLVFDSIFPTEEIALQKKIIVSNLKTQNKKTNVLAGKKFRKVIFGDTAYGYALQENDVEAITREQLLSQYQSFRGNYELLISGNVDDAILQLLEKHFKFAPTAKDNSSKLNLSKSKTAVSEHTELKDAIQTSIRMGKRVIHKTHEDYPKLLVTNHILGGYFGSRLMSNIREDKGLTYGIYSSLVNLSADAYFSIGTDVNKKDKDLAIAEIKKELSLLSTILVSDDELTNVKNHLLGSLQSEFSSLYNISDKFKSVYLYGLDNSYFYKLIEAIKVIQPEDIQLQAATHLRAEDMSVVTVG